MAKIRNQPSYDFITGGDVPSPAARSKARPHEAFRQNQPLPANLPVEDLHARIRTLEYELATLKQEKEVKALQNEQDIRELESKADADFKRALAAESSNAITQRKYEDLLAEAKDGDAKAMNEKQDLERRLRMVSGEKIQVEEERDEVLERLEALERESSRRGAELEDRCGTLQTSFDQLRLDFESQAVALQNSQRKLAQKEAEAGQLESEISRLKAHAGDADVEKLNRQLSEQVMQIKKLEKINRTHLEELTEFRRVNKSMEVVEEEKRTLEGKLRMMETLRTELAQVQLRAQVLDEEKNAWTTFLETQSSDEEGLRFDSPEDMARAFMQQRIQNASLIERLGAVQPELNTKDERIRELEGIREKLQAEIQLAKASSGDASDTKAKARLERQRTLAIKETEYLRAQVKAFEMEEEEFHPERHSEAHTKSIEALQDLVDEYRKEIEKTHAELSAIEKERSTPTTGSKRKFIDDEDASNERMGELLRKTQKLQAEYTQLQTQNAVFSNEIRAQRKQLETFKSSSSRTRILQLRNNPTADTQAIKQATLNALTAENEILKAQIKGTLPIVTSPTTITTAQPNNNMKTEQLVPKASLQTLELTIQDLTSQLASKEKSQKRLRSIFGAKAHEFREAVFSLLGWKLEFQPNGRVKATSMYHPGNTSSSSSSQNPNLQNPNNPNPHSSQENEGENFIIFDGENATMKVSGGTNSAFAREIRGMIDHWVDGRGQVPCLLAAMTLEFFDRYEVGKGTG